MSAGKNRRFLDHHSALRILEVSRRLAAPCELRQLLELVIDVGREVLHADRGAVFLYDPLHHELYTTVATGARQIRFSVERGIAGQCARCREVINVPDCYADPRFNQEIDRHTGYRTRCLIAVPLIGLEEELVGVMQLLNPQKGRFDEGDEDIAAALGAQAAVALQRARLLEERLVKLKLESDLETARQIQLNVLPKRLPSCPGYDLATFSQPAEQTGGDIYDLAPMDGSAGGPEPPPLLIMLADATGHGIGPALTVTQFRAMLRIGLRYSADLDQLVAAANQQLASDLSDNRFITAFVGVLDPQRHTVHYHAPGQGPLLHFQARDRQFHWLNASTIPLGIMEQPPLDPPPPLTLAPGDLLVLLTDGFYEYQDASSGQFGREGVTRVIEHMHQADAKDILDALVREVRRFAGPAPQLDDLTAIIVKRL